MEGSLQSNTAPTSKSQARHRPARSKHGCLTCRRRKVRCDEVMPRCSHCQRLGMQCRWQVAARETSHSPIASSERTSDVSTQDTSTVDYDSSSVMADGFSDVFNYASFMWDGNDHWNSSLEWLNPEFNQVGQQVPTNLRKPSLSDVVPSPQSMPSPGRCDNPMEAPAVPKWSPAQCGVTNVNQSAHETRVPPEDRILTDYFVRAVVPPILVQIETQQEWSAIRQLLMSMFNTSSMVRHSILAFSELLFCRESGSGESSSHVHHDEALSELAQYDSNEPLTTSPGPLREYMLATLFFLSYTDLLQARIEQVHSSLKKAHNIFQGSDKHHFRPVEVKLLCWIRLLDARAVSAGGEGLFLESDNEPLLAYPSPSRTVDSPAVESLFRPDSRIEEAVFNALYQPGYAFFSKVQSFMGRVSKIDPWHRSRGTVEDETEVMIIASKISSDLNALYETRPPLMDYAISGSLTGQHVAPEIAVNITRAFRTYISNFHASKIHLHRVAYKSLPLSSETQKAISAIRSLSRLMVDGPSVMLPVNMLWPLLMWGCEEENEEERHWIKMQILNMQNAATNASITAQVLEEVQSRQDNTKQRVDVRTVMHEIFDSCFAIV